MANDTSDRPLILGISAFYHDSGAALTADGEVIAAAQEERFSREKHDDSFPTQAVEYCLDYEGTTIDDLDAVVFYDKPLLKFERLLETYLSFAPKGLRSFMQAIPVWIREKLFLKKLIRDELEQVEDYERSDLDLLFPEHHLSHAGSAFYPSPYEDAAILTLDGVGEWATATIAHGQGREIEILKQMDFPHSIGLFYSAVTYFLGFRVNSGEYKMMGLAPYGNPESERVQKFEDIFRDEIMTLYDDGSIWLNQDYFEYATGLKMIDEDRWESAFDLERREPESELQQVYCDLALACQNVTEQIIERMARTAREITDSDNLCIAGGVGLNCVSNGRLADKDIFDDIWIQPAAGDAGGALGGALAANYLYFDEEREVEDDPDGMKGSYLGPEYSNLDVENVARQHDAPYRRYENYDELCGDVADILAEGDIVGWFQGKMEWGPRALGNRSILGDPRNEETQKTLNLKIKFRESFRPFAPSVLAEHSPDYFEMERDSRYMILISQVKESLRNELPEDYHEKPLKEKLYYVRSSIPAITHLDFTARLQTVHRDTNPRYWQLIDAFREETGCPIVVNTSFNVRGEPIVRTPYEAYRCFMRTNMDYLVMEDCFFDKQKQPEWPEEKDEWREEIDLD